jgi:hypothetical protein
MVPALETERLVAERMGAKYERSAMLFGSEAGIFRHPPPE